MTYEEIRQARLQTPFRPFKLRLKNGEEHLIQEPTALVISQRILAFVSSRTGVVEETTPGAAESITFVDQIESSKA
jgi:hypothetical protein